MNWEYLFDCINLGNRVVCGGLILIVLSPIWIPLFFIGYLIKQIKEKKEQ